MLHIVGFEFIEIFMIQLISSISDLTEALEMRFAR